MNKIEKGNNSARRHTTNVIALATLFIAAGLAIFAHKLGYLDNHLYDIIVSWQTLLIVLGLWSLVRRQYWNAALLIGIGAFFLIPVIIEAGAGWVRTYWPLLLVLVGILIIVSLVRRRGKPGAESCYQDKTSYDTDEGFVVSENTMGGVKHIVLDPVFKGAVIRNTFGSTVLDLRHTAIAEGETYIDVECSFGALELYVPYGWTVVTNIQPTLAGVDDKRFMGKEEPDPARKLVLRGRVTLGGIEIKN